MTVHLVCVIGPTGSGKTRHCQLMGQHGWEVLFVGAECRKEFGEGAIAAGKNVCTSEVSEDFVRRIVSDFLARGKINGFHRMAIDGFPRSPEQVEWLQKACVDSGIPGFTVTYLFASEACRLGRLEARDGGSTDTAKSALTYRRLIEENAQLQETISALFKAKIYYDIFKNE